MAARDEDQLNEMEAMEAIYGSDYTLISRDVPRQYSLTLSPHTDGTENHVSCRLDVKYPPTYPDVLPSFSLHSLAGLSKDQLSHLTSLSNSEASNCLGSESVMQISSVIRDWLLEHNRPPRSLLDDVNALKEEEEDEDEVDELNASDDEDEPQEKRDARREKREAERRAMRGPSPLGIPPGTVVTVASFMEWKVRFDEEQRRRKEEEDRARAKRDQRMSGKQLWLANLAKELQDDEADTLPEEKEDTKDKLFWYSEGIYADDDVDLPDEEEAGGEGVEGDAGDDGGADDRVRKGKEEQKKRVDEELRKKEAEMAAAAAEEKKAKEPKPSAKADDKAKAAPPSKAVPPPSKPAAASSGAKGKGQPAGGGKGKESGGKEKAKGKK